jgi:hypothetical protein
MSKNDSTVENKAADLIKRSSSLFQSTERTTAEARWQDICKYVLPNQLVTFASVENTSPGASTMDGVYTAEAVIANRDLAAFIRDFADPTERPSFRFVSEELNNDNDAIRWLEEATFKLHHHLSESNLDSEASKNYTMFPALGNMIMLQEQKKPTINGSFGGFVFKSIHLAEIVWAENMDGMVDTVFRKLKLTAKQAVERFGLDVVSDKIRSQIAANKLDEQHDFIHCIYPRVLPGTESSPTGLLDAQKMPFESLYIEVSAKKIVREDGYNEFPIFVTRWDTMPGEVTGRGPGHIAEPEIKTLNRFVGLSLQAFYEAVNTTWLVDKQNSFAQLDLRPNMLNVVDSVDSIKPLRSGKDFSQIDYAHQRFSETIQKIFYLDKLYLPARTETGEMSAYEVSRRMEQAHKVLGPTAGRLNNEFLTPMLLRSFSMLLRAGEFPPVPDILKVMGIDIKVDFVSQLVRTQKLRDGTAIQGWVQQLAAAAQLLGPSIADNIDGDKAALMLGRVSGVPESIIRPDSDVAKMRQDRAQQAQQAQQLESGVKLADMQAKMQRSSPQ